jgi:hypothetical protein
MNADMLAWLFTISRENGRGIYIFFHAIKSIRDELILAILLVEYVEKSNIGTWSDCSSESVVDLGQKVFCTGLPVLRILLVRARTPIKQST